MCPSLIHCNNFSFGSRTDFIIFHPSAGNIYFFADILYTVEWNIKRTGKDSDAPKQKGYYTMHTIKTPVLGKNVYIAPGAIVRGDVTIGDNSSIWFHTVVRAEAGSAVIGDNTNIQDNCVLHVDHGADIRIGSQVTIGHGAIVHGCTIHSNTLIGMGAIIMNHAVIGENCIIGAGALITQNTVIPDNSLVIGNPGKIIRPVTDEEKEDIRRNAAYYVEEAAAYAEQSL